MLRILYALLFFGVLCLGAALSYFNWQSIELNYLAGAAELPLIAVIIGFLVFGVLTGLLIGGARIIALRAELAAARRRLRDAQAELKNLRSLPLKDSTD